MKTNNLILRTMAVAGLLISCSEPKDSDRDNLITLDDGWKFKTGDDPSWCFADFDDSLWDTMDVEKYWEDQGYEGYDGYAWYRTKVIIPSSLKERSYLKDSLQFFLGRIDNCDQFYLKGQFVGENNKKAGVPGSGPAFERSGSYHANRNYILPVSDLRIRWDKENVLAVRVFDRVGDGGFYGSHPHIRILEMKDRLIIDKSGDIIDQSCDSLYKGYWIKNDAFSQEKICVPRKLKLKKPTFCI